MQDAGVGDEELDRVITEPVPEGWTAMADSELRFLVTTQREYMPKVTGSEARVAAKGWTDGTNRFLILVVESDTVMPGFTRKTRDALAKQCSTTVGGPGAAGRDGRHRVGPGRSVHGEGARHRCGRGPESRHMLGLGAPRHHGIVDPPLGRITMPVTNLAAGDAR